MFVVMTGEKTLESHYFKFWIRYKKYLSNSIDRILLYEQTNLTTLRSLWLEKEMSIAGLYSSKRFVSFATSTQRCLRWREQEGDDLVPHIPKKDLLVSKS